MRGATWVSVMSFSPNTDFNPRAPCGARRSGKVVYYPQVRISIHAPHAGRDWRGGAMVARHALFQSTRPMRGATKANERQSNANKFQSTRPMRGATPMYGGQARQPEEFQSTRPMRGATRCKDCKYYRNHPFQSTRPMRGATRRSPAWSPAPRPFQSTRPMRGATRGGGATASDITISIHAPHAGRDSKSIQNYFKHFCDKRQFLDNFTQNTAFQSVLPLADRQKLLYLRCEPLRKFLRAFASHYKIIGSSGR